MKKILQFDVTGENLLNTYDSFNDARKALIKEIRIKQIRDKSNCDDENKFIIPSYKIYIARNLFRESYTANGYIYVFEDDERLKYDGYGHMSLDCVDYTGYDENLEFQIVYKKVNKKYDEAESNNLRIECYKDGEFKIANSVKEAREITGATYVWGALLGENKTSNNWKFRFIKNYHS